MDTQDRCGEEPAGHESEHQQPEAPAPPGNPCRPGGGVAQRCEGRLNAILNASSDAIVTMSPEGVLTDINPAGLDVFEAASTTDLADTPLAGLMAPEHREAFGICMEALLRGEKGYAEFESVGLCGKRRWIEMHAAPLFDDHGSVNAALGILRDNTARRDLNKQFIQAQKMEVLGTLAGGVAHDFNNMLGIILGYTEMMMDGMAVGSAQRRDAQSIFHTAQRAAALTQQLLIFSRKQALQPQVVDLSELIVGVDPMLRRLIGENIKLETIPEPDLGPVEADPCQIEQVLMNLTINARDAMPGGGIISIETSNAHVAGGDPAHPGIPEGKYSVLCVRDTGGGMSEELMSKIFDPFFTTKPAGQGTGLGLATCQGIVRYWRGRLEVESRLGAGTTFRVYLPCLAQTVVATREQAAGGPPPRGDETILVVEDEPGLLALTTIVLQRQGYTVLKASNGREALALVHQRHGRGMDLVITDMVMPEMGGKMMADWLHAIDPSMKILFTTGYSDWDREGAIDATMEFIPKPYTPSALLRKVREVIDRNPVESPGIEDAA